jgi:uncharacterized integral membrane protein
MRVVRRLLGIVIFVGVLALGWRFAAQNSAEVTVDVLVGRFSGVSLWLTLVVAFAAGGVVVGLAGLYQLARLGLIVRRYRKTVRGLEAEVHQLRNLPLAEEERPASGVTAPPSTSLEGALERGT